MKKHLSRTLALLLAVVMILSVLPAAVFATDKGEGASLMNGLPADGSYGVIYCCGEGYSNVMGYDITGGNAAVCAVELTEDGEAIKSLPNGTAIIKFVKNSDGTYYFMLGSQYLVIKDLDSNNKEKLALCDTAEKGAKWTIKADQAGMSGAYNIMNAEYKWNGKSDVYLEQYNNQKYCGYSYSSGDSAKYFQFKFFETSADEDGRVGVLQDAGALPEAGKSYVIYCAASGMNGGVFGQQTDETAAKQDLTCAEATMKGGELAYNDVGDGGLIFTVSKEGNYFIFKTGDKWLGMSENYKDESTGKVVNDECLILVDTKNEYCKWELSAIDGGWLMKNKEAQWKGNPVYIEFFNDLFAGYSFDSSNPAIFAMQFIQMDDKYNCGYVVNPSIVFEDIAPAAGTDCTVKFTLNDLNEQVKTTASYWFDSASGAKKTAEVTYNQKIGSFTIPSADIIGHTKLYIDVAVEDSMGLKFNGTLTEDIVDQPIIESVSPAANAATGDDKRPTIEVNFLNAKTNPTVTMKLDNAVVNATVSGEKATYKPTSNLAEGKHVVNVVIKRTDGKTAEKTWAFFVGEGGATLYFGQIHSHTAEYSDGAGTLEQAYEHAYDADDVDFLIVTDHSNYFDTTKKNSTASYYDLSTLAASPDGTTTKWEEARATAAAYNEKYNGELICAYGYEMTWSGGPGHTNSFNTYGTVSRNNTSLNNKTNYAGMLLYNDLMVYANQGKDINGESLYNEDGTPKTEGVRTKYIESAPVVSQFNHPGTTFGNFGNFTGCTALRDSVLTLVEVGNGEGKVGGSSYWPSINEYDLCLSMGWHVAPTNNQDNHKGNWGDSNTCRDVILTDDFTEEGIYNALAARRCYSTEDQNFEIYYTLTANGTEYTMGDIATISKDNQPKQVTLTYQISDPDSKDVIGTVYVIGENGKVLGSKSYTGNSCKDSITVDNTAAYYYLKVVQKDGEIAVTAPVWTSESTPVNVAVETDAAVSVQGTEENITASLVNGSETETITLVKYTVKVDGVEIASKDLSEDLKPGKEKAIVIPYTPKVDASGKDYTQNITAYFRFIYKGETYTFNATMKELVINAKNAVYVGIDRGHTNFYVSGDYANCETSFIQICADNGIICEYIKEGEMTKENLAKYDMIVITTPRVSDSVPPTVFTKSELSALQYYSVTGGSIINLGKSDRYDFDKELGAGNGYIVEDDSIYSSAYLNNQINIAVGSKTRFADGIVVDNTWKTNEAYRINFYNSDDINLFAEDPFTEGMVTTSNGIYQFYNGTSVIIADGDEKNVKTLVKGYDTSWVTSYTDCFTGSAYVPDYAVDPIIVPQGEVNLVTREKLPGGGFLICSGTTFISTYDLKTGVTDPEQYANYIMVMNILNYVKNGEEKVGTITPIKTVHAGGANGKEYTIEGWVTSNASDYDVDTAFFDCIYAQDATRGINLFPVSGNYYIGEKIRAHGAATEYCGEIELNLGSDHHGSIKVISNSLHVIEPKKVSCKDAMADSSIGNLMQISGIVKDIHRTEGVVDYIYVDDGSGTLGCLFINNYIMKDYTGLDDIQKGMAVTGIGIGSRDVNENDKTGKDPYIKRLRVRNRSEITAYWDPCGDYKDVNRSAWYHSAVDFVIENGYMGSTDTKVKKFEPNTKVSRAMITSIMYRIAGDDAAVPYTGAFTDVKEGSWYTTAIEWCAQNSLASGYTDGTFKPNATVSRQELAVFMYRLAKYMGYDVSGQADLSDFPDAAKVGTWAKTAMAWAVDYGIISGQATSNSKPLLNPTANATRAELASILMRFLQNLEKLDKKDDIVILYTNDVHCGVDNSEQSFGYAGLAAYKKQMEDMHDYVGLVDCGDAVQGEAIGTLSKGEYIIDLMNYLGYEAATFGNHEFDYGMDQLSKLVEKADFDYVSANFQYIGEGKGAVDPAPYTIKTYGDVKIAYVGIATPESLVKSTPTYFQDAEGNWIYSFCNDATGEALYASVQEAVDAAKAENPDYIIALAHLGDDEASKPWRSADVIANTTGIDVVLDGHSHSVIPGTMVKNKDGEEVLLTSTGTKLANIGKLVITKDGEIRSELIARKNFDKVDEDAQAFLDEIEAKNAELLQTVVAHSDVDLVVNNPDTGIRAVRYRETNLGDVCADAYRYVMDSDIAFVNGGGVRADIKAGDITYEQIIAVHPFGNAACVVKASGQQIIDALEMAARAVTCDAETGKIDGENGGFLQVSGIKFTINTAIKSTVVTDVNAMFQEVTGDRRVMEVMVYNKDLDKYEPIDTDKTYLLASHNYMLKQGGDGLNMFMNCELVQDETKLDNQVLIEYMTSDEFKAHDYSTWTGEGRIKIINDPEYVPSYVDDSKKGYTLADSLKSGDKVVIYNPVQGKAISTDMYDGYHIKAEDVTPVQGEIKNPAANIIWTVVKNADGSYSFTNGNKGIYSYISGTYYDLATSNSGSYDDKWTLTPLNGKLHTFSMSSVATPDLYMEWYINYYSAYGTETPTDDAFGLQFYRYGKMEDCAHEFASTADSTEASCTAWGIGSFKCSECGYSYAEVIKALGHDYVLNEDETLFVCSRCGDSYANKTSGWLSTDAPADGDIVMIVIGGSAITTTPGGNGFVGEAAAVTGGVLTPADTYLKFKVKDAGDGMFYLMNEEGTKYLQAISNKETGGYGNQCVLSFVDEMNTENANYCYRYDVYTQDGVAMLRVVDAEYTSSAGMPCTVNFELYGGNIYPYRAYPTAVASELAIYAVQFFKYVP